MERVIFISTQNLKNDTIIENNAEDYILKPCIYDAHLIELQEVLGELFYKDLINKTVNDTLSQEEIDLIKTHIYDFLIKVSLYRSIPFLWAKFENTSIVTKRNETSESIEYKDLQMLRNETLNDVGFLRKRLIDYLNQNITNFPLFKCSSNCNVLNPNTNTYNRVGIFL
jgi:hypothetical protein